MIEIKVNGEFMSYKDARKLYLELREIFDTPIEKYPFNQGSDRFWEKYDEIKPYRLTCSTSAMEKY